jgi:O-antigen/teichoic acid export membrane protein
MGLSLRRLGGDIAQTVLRYVVALVLGLGLTILLARILGPDGNGKYSVAVLLPSILSTLLNLGIGPANVFFVGRHEVSVAEAYRSNLRLWGGLGLLGVLVGGGVIHFRAEAWFPGLDPLLLWLVLPAFPLSLLQGFCASLLQGKQDFGRYNLTLLATPAATLALVAVLVWGLDLGVVGALSAYLGGNLYGLGYTRYVLQPYLRKKPVDGTQEYDRQSVSYGWKAHLGNIMAFFNYRADLFLVNFFLVPAAAGIYVIAIQIAERLWILSRSVSTVLLPRLSELHEEEDLRKRLTPRVARWVGVLSLIAALVLAPIASWLIELVFGAEYQNAAGALRWLLPGVVVGAIGRVLANDIAARGRPELNMYTSAGVLVVNVGANVLLIPPLGIDGAAIATSISYLLNVVAKLVIYAELSGNTWWRPLIFDREDIRLIRRVAAEIG